MAKKAWVPDPEVVRAVAVKFSELIQESFGDKVPEINRRNRELKEDGDSCATHDFCDANEVMAEAFRKVVGREQEMDSDKDTDIWNAAWSLAQRTAEFDPAKAKVVEFEICEVCHDPVVGGKHLSHYAARIHERLPRIGLPVEVA